MKKLIAILMVSAIVCTSALALTGCSTASAAANENIATADSAQTVVAVRSEENAHNLALTDGAAAAQLEAFIADSGANGYTVCKIAGCAQDQLVLSYGTCEADRYYDVYTILNDELSYVGRLPGAHTIAYIDGVTGTLWMAKGHMGVYSYGPVVMAEVMEIQYSDERVMGEGEAYPELTGAAIDFLPINDFSAIEMF